MCTYIILKQRVPTRLVFAASVFVVVVTRLQPAVRNTTRERKERQTEDKKSLLSDI